MRKGKKNRKIWICLVILCILAAVVGVFFCFVKRDKPSDNQETEYVDNPDVVTTWVFRGTLKSTFHSEAVVSGDERGYLDTYTGTCDDELQVSVGDYVESGDALILGNDNDVRSLSKGYIVDAYKSNEMTAVTVLNVEHLYVTISMPYEQFCLVDYDAEVKITEEETVLEGYIHRLGYLYQDGYVDVMVGFDGYIMPGKTVEVDITMEETDEKQWIPAAFVSEVGGVTVTYVIDDFGNKETHMQEIEVGEEYLCVEDGNEFYYYEVLGGLTDGQQIASAPMMISADEAEQVSAQENADEEF